MCALLFTKGIKYLISAIIITHTLETSSNESGIICILRYKSLTWTKYDYSTGTGYLGTGAEIYQAGFVVDVPGGHTAKT